MIEDINDLKLTNFNLEKEKIEISNSHKRMLDNLNSKIKILENTNKDKVQAFEDEIKQLKSEIKIFEEYKKENLKMSNMLFLLYNKLIERLKLNRDIIIDKSLLITEKDFEPSLFDNKEIITYIDAMLITSSEEMSSKMLRETIAYANMMLRTYLKDKLNKKFNPVETFKEIKNYLDNLTLSINDSDNNRKNLEREVKELKHKLKKFQGEIKYKQIQFENMQKKFDLQINVRIQKSRDMRNQMIKSKERKKSSLHNKKDKLNLTNLNSIFIFLLKI